MNSTVWDIGFVSTKYGWLFTGSASGSLFTGNSLKITEDGGRTWRDASIPTVPGIRLEQAQFVGEKHGWLMGTGEGAFVPDSNNSGSGTMPSVVVFWDFRGYACRTGGYSSNNRWGAYVASDRIRSR